MSEAKDRIVDILISHPTGNISTSKIAEIVNCSKRYVRKVRQDFRNNEGTFKLPNIILFDIETSPMEVTTWGLFKQYISPDNVIKEWSVLSWAAKRLFDSEIMSEVVTPKQAINREDKSILKGMWKLMDEADIVIAHNGKRFDVRKLNARFILNGFSPPSPYQVIDTLQHSKRHFAFSSHKLDYLNLLNNKTRKIKTEYELWLRCIGNYGVKEATKALKEIEQYNKGDIVALEDLYLFLRPWIKSHPNMALYMEMKEGEERCPNCGSKKITYHGKYFTMCGRYKTFRCECGAIGRSRFSDISPEERKYFGVSIAR